MVALEAFLEQSGVSRTASLADIVREMNQRFHGDDPAYYVVPDDSRGVAQLLLLFTFQGGDLGAFALGDFSAGEVIGFHATRSGAEQVGLVRAVTEYLNEHFSAYGSAQMVGSTRIQASMFASIARSQIASLLTSILAAGFIVVLLMGSVLYGLISLIPLLFTVAVNFGIMAFLGMPLDIATLMVSSITIGIGIDYGIHFIVRYREGKRAGLASADAAIQTARYAGRGILFNALALALGFSVLLLSAFHGMRSFGGLISMTMIISALAALTVIPALLVVIGGRKGATASGGGPS
jgi:predicted RND superfamily exporter protein